MSLGPPARQSFAPSKWPVKWPSLLKQCRRRRRHRRQCRCRCRRVRDLKIASVGRPHLGMHPLPELVLRYRTALRWLTGSSGSCITFRAPTTLSRPMIPSSFHMGGKKLYSQTLQVVFQLIFVCISLIFVTDADENELEFNLQGLKVELLLGRMKWRGDYW